MQQHRDHGRLYSASDLVAHLGCQHRTTLDLRRLAGWDVQPATPDATLQLVQQYGNAHEREHLEDLAARGLQIVEIDKDAPLEDQVEQTRTAMRDGAGVIFQATLLRPPFLGYADFLMRVPGASDLGDYHYEVADTKLAKSNQAKFLVQLGLYADLLAAEQGVLPERLHIVLGQLDAAERQRLGMPADGPNTAIVRTQDCIHYVRNLTAGFLEFVQREAAPTEPNSRALPNAACSACPWHDHCSAEWERNDHICRVANIRRSQILRLETAGVTTMNGLASLGTNSRVRGIDDAVLARLVRQAELQIRPTDDAGKLRWTPLEARADGEPSGFDLLPEPDPGDLYFDMEGFPHVPGGLEYLFGIGWADSTEPSGFKFQAFWAHDRAQEKQSFESFMDFVEKHLDQHPKAHVYHYAPYERTAIKRLSSVHDTRAEFRDRLLREHRLVDLYKVVRSGMLLALPSYSIKRVEIYYGAIRQGDVATAGESIVRYEAYRVSHDTAAKEQFLREIESYNRDDVESTGKLHRWLEALRTDNGRRQGDGVEAAEPAPVADNARAREQRERAGIERIRAWAAQDLATRWPLAELLGQLLGFYWRCKLPTLWRQYERLEAEPEDLLDDQECLAMLSSTGERTQEARSLRYFYTVPDQETKLSTGAAVMCLSDGGAASGFEYDETMGVASFKRSANSPAPPELVTLCARDDVSYERKLDSIHAYVDVVCAGQAGPDAVQRLLTRSFPQVGGILPGDPLMPPDTPETERVDAMLRVIGNLEASHLVIQGPPGTGKTTFASQVIARLVKEGRKVAITSNSHAAINHLLVSSWNRCREAGIDTIAAVVRQDDNLPQDIRVLTADDVDSDQHRLVGGTAWLFCRPNQRARWDYLFVDEASQVSLADVVAAGPCARNIVLLGDQMQLPQPTQGIHPGDSGLSALEFIMLDRATVPPSHGIFLGRTFRMHPAICKPVSEGVYEGRLQHAPSCEQQRLLLREDADTALRPSGVFWVPVAHTDRSQSAPEETERIDSLYRCLLAQRWINHKGEERAITPADILVLAPYNAQVRALKNRLGPDARVGTVDKFQGQEAAVAICSMTSSDTESMPRGLDFLFSINRLNVAVSRARCLALIVASPGLRTPMCGSLEDVGRASFFARLTATQ